MNLHQLLRSLGRPKLNTIVIIISLSIGLASINLISIFIFRELKTDDFHRNSKQIYSLTTNNPFEPGHKEFFCRYGSAEYITQNFSQVEDFCRFRKAPNIKTVVNNTPYFDDAKLIEASANFFEFFSYQLLTNNPKTALETSQNIVISNALAEKYFGTASPLGQIIKISSGGSDEDFIVSAIFKKPQQNSQISFDMVKKIGEKDSPCFLQLSKGASKEEVETLLAQNLKDIPTMHSKDETAYYLSSLRDTYFTPLQRSSVESNRDPTELWIALGIGILILLIAMFNYLGLVNNNLFEKHKEYIIRLINGSSKQGLIKKFMFENFTYLALSFAISFGLMICAFPAFNNLVSTNLESRFLFYPQQLLMLSSSIIVLYLVSYLFVFYRINSALNANILSMKEQKNLKGFSTSPLTILQLVAAIVLITSSIVIIKQIQYISEKPLGINKEVVEIKLPWTCRSIASVFRNELQKSTSIDKVSIVSTSPVLDNFLVKWKYIDNEKEVSYTPAGFGGDENYIETLGIQIVKGNDFGQYSSYRDKCLINQTMANKFPDKNLVGNELPGSGKTVIGIVEDFHYNDLKKVVEPAFIEYTNEGNYLLAKPVNGKLEEAKEYIAGVWQQLIPDYVVNIESINDRYEWLHRENRNFVTLISVCSIISVFLSMIGLFALSVDKSRKRIKEIGIRKINGAKIAEVLALLNKDIITWVAIAYIIATPLAWFAMRKWLENFAYKTDLSWWFFALAGLLALGVALITVSWQSWRAATRNPVEALRYE